MTKHYSTLSHNVWLPYKFAVGPAFYRFYEGLKEEKILGNVCPECQKTLVPARSFCPECSADMGEWKELAQEGEIVHWMIANEPLAGLPFEPPFAGALIRLDGTDCNFLHIVGGIDFSDPETVKSRISTGTRVKAVWSAEKNGHMLDIRYFAPI